jgi:hypothetical protein
MLNVEKRMQNRRTNTLALMVAASFCAGFRHKRYSGQQVPGYLKKIKKKSSKKED